MALLPVASASTTYHTQCMRNKWQVRAKWEASGMAVSTPWSWGVGILRATI